MLYESTDHGDVRRRHARRYDGKHRGPRRGQTLRVPSMINSRRNSANAAKTWNISRPPGTGNGVESLVQRAGPGPTTAEPGDAGDEVLQGSGEPIECHDGGAQVLAAFGSLLDTRSGTDGAPSRRMQQDGAVTNSPMTETAR
jgi:hypothetical protein